ncbi:mammaglobin-B-like isoform X3 [Ochotona princeps]|uniref:mammaglobin-B-like isoform X3 n=1 Tax=Ochotona princeps TaxID=9978 RepID=UPI002714DD94|nr:mammaglobin-B-like isoform X3 [Ochotona princeps]XP_058518912.1 mammaglobin-B-like isoform X3 [Ochotona princeps]
MKLVVVLMLAALPLYCYAGSGCQLLEDVVEHTIDPEVSVDEYTEYLAPYIHSEATKEAVEEFKQCFLSQSNETLANVRVMVHTIYDSVYCAPF